jgi:hypothetical protein
MAEHSSGELPVPGGMEARKAVLSHAVLSTVIADDMAAIEAALSEKASGGDKQATRLAEKVGRLTVAWRDLDPRA